MGNSRQATVPGAREVFTWAVTARVAIPRTA